MENKKYNRKIRHFLSVPFIWILIFPAIILDLFVELYHRICFPLYGLPLIKRSDYIKIDRHKLSYLSIMDKLNCVYCGYGNGLAAYLVRIGGDTERYWCGIKHENDKNFNEPKHHKYFLKYGDEKSSRKLK